MRNICGYEVKEFIYDTKEERENHIAQMVRDGWEQSGQTRRLKPGVSLMLAKPNDYEWFAQFRRETIDM